MIQIPFYIRCPLSEVDVNRWPQAPDVFTHQLQTLASDFSSPWGCPRALFGVTQMPDCLALSNEKSERHKEAVLGALTQIARINDLKTALPPKESSKKVPETF